jgi:2-polyprenyl-6-methoxyphenol hydroxylase-like FAD-dependent oxidoreductase
MSAVRNVLIVGGGIGGLSTAIGLGRIGVRADVVEIQKQWAIYGVGIIQPGNAIRAYKALGVADRCLERGFVYKRQRHYDSDGKYDRRAHDARHRWAGHRRTLRNSPAGSA